MKKPRPGGGATLIELRRIWWSHRRHHGARLPAERGIMTHIETVAAEFADLFPQKLECVDLDLNHDRPRLLVIEGDRK